MATLAELEHALREADAARNVEDARALAGEIRRLRAQAPVVGESRQQLEERAAATYAPADPTEGASLGENLLAGFASRAGSLLRGAQQVGADIVSLAPGALGASGEREGARLRAEETAVRRQDAPLRATGGGFTGGLGADAASLIGPGVFARGTTIGRAFLPQTVRGGVAQGAVIGAMQPLAEGEGRGLNAAFGAGGGLLGSGVARLLGASRRVFPSPRQANVEREAAGLIQEAALDPRRVRSGLLSPDPVRGVRSTTAEATQDIGLAGLQRTLANRGEFGSLLAQQRIENNAARVQALRSVFHGADEAAAQQLRQEAAEIAERMLPDIKRVRGAETMRVVRSLDRMANSPDFRNFPEAERFLSAVRGRLVTPLPPQERVSTARSILQDFFATPKRGSSAAFAAMQEARRLVIAGQRDGVPPEAIADQLRKVQGATAQGQTAIADAIKALRTTEAGKPDVASLYNARKYITQNLMPRLSGQTMLAARSFLAKLDDEIVSVAPTFRDYLRGFAAESRKADQAMVGAELLERGRAVRDPRGNPTLYPESFARAARDLDQLVRRVTGFRRATAERTLTAPQRQAIESVRTSLERQAFPDSAGRAVGSNTVQNLLANQSLGQQAAQSLGGRLLQRTPGVGFASEMLSAVRQRHGDRVMAVVEEAMLNPQRAQDIFNRLPQPQRRAVLETLNRLGAPVGAQLGAQTGQLLPLSE